VGLSLSTWDLQLDIINKRFVHYYTENLCQTYCNPASLSGSAPNLVTVEHDRFGQPHFKCAFNTQACEQLNAWLGGFQSILNRMTAGNFDWFLHINKSYM
jgi:hypothetical protein